MKCGGVERWGRCIKRGRGATRWAVVGSLRCCKNIIQSTVKANAAVHRGGVERAGNLKSMSGAR